MELDRLLVSSRELSDGLATTGLEITCVPIYSDSGALVGLHATEERALANGAFSYSFVIITF